MLIDKRKDEWDLQDISCEEPIMNDSNTVKRFLRYSISVSIFTGH